MTSTPERDPHHDHQNHDQDHDEERAVPSAEPGDGGGVVPFPTLPGEITPADPAGSEVAPAGSAGAVEPAAEVLVGEIETDDEYARRTGLERLPDLARQRVVALVVVVRESPRTQQVKALTAYRVRKAPRDVARLTWFALRGHGRWIWKGWAWLTYADLRADYRAARLARDPEARRAAQEAIRADQAARRARRAELAPKVVGGAAVVVVVGTGLEITDSVMARADMPGWLAGIYTVLDVIGAVLPWLLALAAVGWLVAAMVEGRDKTPGAGFLIRPDRDDADSWIDERMISQALAHLGIGPLDRFFKAGGELVYTVPARADGDGTYAQVKLPMGVTADMVAGQRTKLAANLGRASLETWPTQGDEAGILDLWIADKGKLGGGAGPWPLQHAGTVDLFAGVPFGLTQRGRVIDAPLFESNWLIGGRPGQGKSAAMRTLLLGAALDPTAELWVFVMGQSPDFGPFEPRLSRYAMGMDDSVAEAALEALTDLLAEMERRGKVLGAQPGSPPKTSRKLADKPHLGLHPLVCAIDECHELFMHPTYGKQAAELAVRLIKRGRKYGIILLLATQSPTKDSIPREVTRNVSCGVAFAVSDHVANDGLLGAGKYKAGIRATDLRMKTDRGTCVAVGVTDNVFELVRTFYVPFDDETDQVTPVIARAMDEIGELRRTGIAADVDEDTADEADHLADIADVLRGEPRVRTQVVLARLAEHQPGVYEDWTFSDLKTALADHGVEIGKSHGHSVVRATDLTRAMTHRHHDAEISGDDEDEEAGI